MPTDDMNPEKLWSALQPLIAGMWTFCYGDDGFFKQQLEESYIINRAMREAPSAKTEYIRALEEHFAGPGIEESAAHQERHAALLRQGKTLFAQGTAPVSDYTFLMAYYP